MTPEERQAATQAIDLERIRVLEDVRVALERVYSGAESVEAAACLDHLGDLGRRVL